MKLAICFSGELRYLDRTKNFWLDIKNKYNADIYAAFWGDVNNDEISNFKELFQPLYLNIENKLSIENTVNQLTNEIGNFDFMEKNIKNKIINGNIIYMSYLMWKCNTLTKLNNEKYDIILRTRPDITLDKLNIYNNEYFNLPRGRTVINEINNNWGFTDIISYSNPKLMDYYTSFIFYYMKYLKEGHFTFSPEYLFRVHLNNKNVKIREFDSYIYVQRDNGVENYNKYILKDNKEIITILDPSNIKIDNRFNCYINNNEIYNKN